MTPSFGETLRHRWRWTGFLARVAVLAGLLPLLSAEAKAEEPIDQAIGRFSNHLLLLWRKDPQLSKVAPPQIIANVSANTKVYGGCGAIIGNQVRIEVGGTSYCPGTNTIFVVADQLRSLYVLFGAAAIGYALAHEYGHYIQAKFQIKGDTKLLELQGDCLAGVILGQNSSAVGIRQADVASIAQSAYAVGDPTHGTGDQRSFAVYSGLGQSSELTCSLTDMAKLAINQVRDPRFGSLSSLRTAGGTPAPYAPRGPHLRSISGSLGL
jgi:hypothetical protein